MAAGDAPLLAKYRAALLARPRPQPVKMCKFCMERIPLGALVCKFCSREVNTAEEADALSRTYMEDVVAQNEKQQKARFWKWVVVGAVVIIIIFFMSRH
jgi:predicted amidophosphoribosyltransferase